ncbi:ribosylglycoyhydrolase [Streptomyces davaonensis JCM 4913]|uniref:Ribosylglycoyhydrolase n=1 Tax=Streptomyces davaonensis (strain DSM 101723 / JCM 4913 / KCC S-0913 / 768) TaxID=1214101 RepID=K4R062_STRDJ|nr:ribosylglycoyhydrolase [Streptomyces davaonensis JCM 4913]
MAAALHFQVSQRAAGNGALMRAAPSAVHFAAQGRAATMDAARTLSALTHGDAAAWEGTAILHELIRVTLAGDDPLAAVRETLEEVHPDHVARYATVLSPDWHPDRATEFNGAVWPCLGSAVWALRTTTSYEEAVRAAIDLGGDTDTVAAVTGSLAGAVYGIGAVPKRWTELLHVPLPGFGERVLDAGELAALARGLVTAP